MRLWIWMLILGGIFAWQHRYEIRDVIDPPQPIANAGDLSVVLYATQWCGYCAKARELFKSRNVPYQEFDIERSAEGEAQYRKLGGNGVPVIVINGAVIHGYDRAAIEKALIDL